MSAPGLGSSASRQPPVCTGARTHNQSHRYKSICFTLLQRCVSLPRLFQRLHTTGEGWRWWRARNKGKLTLEMETARGSLIKRKLLDNGLLKYARLFLLLLPLKKINKYEKIWGTDVTKIKRGSSTISPLICSLLFISNHSLCSFTPRWVGKFAVFCHV